MTELQLQKELYGELLTAMQGLPPWIAEPPELHLGQRNMALINALADFVADTIIQTASPGYHNSEMIADYLCGRLVKRVVAGRCEGRA